MSESAVLSLSAVEFPDRFPGDMRVLLDYHLAYTVTVIDSEIIFSEIDKNDSYLSAVVGVDRAWRIGYGYAVIKRHSASRANLTLISGRKLHIQSRGDQRTLKRS